MNNKSIKKILGVCLLTGTAILFSNSSFAYAKESIPQHMKPGSMIEIDDSTNIKVISGGYSNDKAQINEMILPEAEPGMKISYDGMGLVNKIININNDKTYEVKYIGDEDIQKVDTDVEGAPQPYFEPGTTNWKYSGWITWFTDKIGQQDHELRDWDCATKMDLDNPVCGTSIRLRDETKYTEALLAKWDIGALPNAVLDIRPNMFTNTFGYNLDIGHFKGRYGHFFPYQ